MGFANTDLTKDFETLPAGSYSAVIVKAGGKPESPNTRPDGMVTCKDGVSSYLPICFQITSGKFEGQCVWLNLNLVHVKPAVKAAACRDYAAMLRACGYDLQRKPQGPDTLEEFIGLRCQIQISIGEYQGAPRPEIKKFSPQAMMTNAACPY